LSRVFFVLSRKLGQFTLAPLKVKGANRAKRLLAGAVELVLPEGNLVLKLGDARGVFFNFHTPSMTESEEIARKIFAKTFQSHKSLSTKENRRNFFSTFFPSLGGKSSSRLFFLRK
tara:strand:- start:846 stop:1193 length:348 start_codon:yes stop_codon:yes gene_type:complete